MKARFLALVALVLGLASCQTEPEGLDVNVGGAVDTTITVSIPETETRAGGTNSAKSVFENGILDADNVTMRYIFQVFYKGEASKATPQVAYSDGKSVNFDVRLVPGRDYTFVVWADVVNNANPVNGDRINDDWHYNTSDLTNITINPTTWVAMDESRDAFTVSEEVTDYNGAKTIELKLKRPFAKLRVKTTDMKALNDLVITPKTATVAYAGELYSAFNAYDSEVTGDKMEKTHTNFAIASYGDNKTNESMILFTDYLFAKSEAEVVNFTLDVFDQNGESIKFNNFNTAIPAQRNYLTTISGNVLTDGNNVKVDVQDAFENAGNLEDEPYYVEIWDGKTIKVPAQNEAGNYVIERGSELAWLAAAVSGTLETRAAAADSFAGKTFVLNADIDLGGNEWKPIGMGGKHFEGIFDGQGYTIKGLQVTERYYKSNGEVYPQAALFCSLAGNAQIKNIVIDEAYVKYPADSKDYYASAIAGTIYGSNTFENITVKNSTITGNNKVGAIFAHDGSSTQITINNCHVDNCHIASEDLKDGGNVGGLIGLFQTGSNKVSSINNSSVKNSTIVGINSSNSGKRANSQFIGGIYTKANTNLVLKNCVVENNEFSQTINGTDAVTYVGTFDANFIGGDRDEKRLGVVVINGTRYEGDNEPKNVSAGNGEWYATIEEAIADGNNEISLGDGEFNTPAGLSNGQADNTLTIVGNGIDKTTVNGATNTNNMHPGNYAHGLDLVLENLTFVTTNNGYNGGFGHAKSVTFRNCKIVGQFYAHSGAPHYFYDCTIDPLTGYLYTYSSDCVFERCTFSASEGKALQIYSDANTGDHTVTITDCEFVAAKQAQTLDGKPVTGIDINSNGAKFTVAINGCTATGFPAGLNSKSTLWNVKDAGKVHVNVYVDGAQVWFAGYDVVANGLFKKDSAYVVMNAEGLAALNAMMVNQTAGKAVKVTLGADIDFTGKTWTPVNSHVDTPFYFSELDGNGKTISNFTINGQAMFTRFAGSGNVTIKNVTFDNAQVNSNGNINTSILTVQTYQNVLLDNVDVKNSTIIGGYKVAPLIATVYNEGASTITATLKNCDVENTVVKATSYDFCTTGMVAFVYEGDNDRIAFENCTVKDVKLMAKGNGYAAHAAIYVNDKNTDDLINEAEGVIVENVTFEAL